MQIEALKTALLQARNARLISSTHAGEGDRL
jgi:hypothetical protein